MAPRCRIAVLGSTGSIGTQTLDLVRRFPQRFEVSVLTAGSNASLLARQALELRPACVVIADEGKFGELKRLLDGAGIEVCAGADALADAMDRDDFDSVVTATVGYSGLEPTLRAIRAGKRIALANKETLVVAGELVNRLLAVSPSVIVPVDSEHSAIYQCLVGEDPANVERLIITASGGPFLHVPAEKLGRVTVQEALHHPNWAMGAKITIDSATMLNKAFEIIEAHWLFGVEANRIEAVVHPQSIVHSMVQFADGAVKAQLGVPDMHLPICYALTGGERLAGAERHLSAADYAELTFMKPDTERFPCLTLARTALDTGGNAACVINAAGEVANLAFREGRIPLTSIYTVITGTLERASRVEHPDYGDYVASNAEARRIASEIVDRLSF